LAIWPSTYLFVRPVGVCNSVIPLDSCCHPWCLHWPSVFLVYVCVCLIAPWAEGVLKLKLKIEPYFMNQLGTFTSAVHENLRWGSENGDAVGKHSCVLLYLQRDKKNSVTEILRARSPPPWTCWLCYSGLGSRSGLFMNLRNVRKPLMLWSEARRGSCCISRWS
jgi:hypothetical protein